MDLDGTSLELWFVWLLDRCGHYSGRQAHLCEVVVGDPLEQV